MKNWYAGNQAQDGSQSEDFMVMKSSVFLRIENLQAWCEVDTVLLDGAGLNVMSQNEG